MSLANTRDPALERARLCVVIATVVVNVIAVSLLTFAPWSDWRTGAALNFVDNCLLVGFVVVRRDALLARFLLFGVVVGLTELAADAWLVDYTRTLDYSIGGGPMIWRSQLWMPLAWEVVAVQFGYIGLRLWERFGKTGLLMIGLLGAINIPFYEEIARRIHWWQYSPESVRGMISYACGTSSSANLASLWCSHCGREPFAEIRGASPLLPASLAEHRFLFATPPPF